MKSHFLSLLVTVMTLTAAGCCTDRRSSSSKPDETAKYQVSPDDYQQIYSARRSEKSRRDTTQPTAHPLQILALSGGGSNGAWGAGFLCGWTQSGTRPKFDIVTGVSTGALIASAALTGDDATLREAFTKTSDKQVQANRWFFQIPFSDSLRDTRGLFDKRIKHFVTNEKIDDVAKAAAQGRFVFVASTNLDSGRLVVWNLSKMAQDKQYDLYRKAIYASASAPILYPPVMIGGHMHVDGGVRASLVFNHYLLPSLLPNRAFRFKKKAATMAATVPDAQQNLFVIVNGEIGISSDPPPDCIVPIAERTLSCLFDANSIGSLYEAAYFATGFELNITSIPSGASNTSFNFDPVEMTKLFNLAEKDGQTSQWKHDLPSTYGL